MRTLATLNKKLLLSTFSLSLTLWHSASVAMVPEEGEFRAQTRMFRQRIINEKQIPLDNNRWAVSFLVKPDKEEMAGAVFGHAILAFIGGTAENPLFWAADFTANFDGNNPIYYIRGATCVNCGYINTFDDQQDRNRLTSKLSNFSSWQYNAWEVPISTAQTVRIEINSEKLDPPYYNLFGHNTWGAFSKKYTYNCSGWACEKVKKCITISGTWLYQATKISWPAIEWAFNHK